MPTHVAGLTAAGHGGVNAMQSEGFTSLCPWCWSDSEGKLTAPQSLSVTVKTHYTSECLLFAPHIFPQYILHIVICRLPGLNTNTGYRVVFIGNCSFLQPSRVSKGSSVLIWSTPQSVKLSAQFRLSCFLLCRKTLLLHIRTDLIWHTFRNVLM